MAYAEHFSIENIPYGIATVSSKGSDNERNPPRPVTRLENRVFFLDDLDLKVDPVIKQTFSQVRAAMCPEDADPLTNESSRHSTHLPPYQSPDCENSAQVSRAP